MRRLDEFATKFVDVLAVLLCTIFAFATIDFILQKQGVTIGGAAPLALIALFLLFIALMFLLKSLHLWPLSVGRASGETKDNVVLTSGKATYLFFFVFSFALIGLGGWALTQDGTTKIMGLGMLALGGFMAVMYFWFLMSGNPMAEFNRSGLSLKMSGGRSFLIPWVDIEKVGYQQVDNKDLMHGNVSYVAVFFKDKNKYNIAESLKRRDKNVFKTRGDFASYSGEMGDFYVSLVGMMANRMAESLVVSTNNPSIEENLKNRFHKIGIDLQDLPSIIRNS